MAVTAWSFVRLKLRITGNGLRGRTARIVVFVLGAVAAGFAAVVGYSVFAVPGLLDNPRAAGLLFPFGGALLVLGWFFLPLLFFGVDDSLDPAQFALLPLPRRTLITGLAAAALAGIPALSTLAATAGTVDSAARLGGPGAAFAQVLGIISGLVLCVVISRALTSAFAGALRSRRARDLATIMLAVVAASIGPAQLLLLGLVNRADWDSAASIATIVGWTPLAAPYTMGLDVAAGRVWAVPLKLLIVLVVIAAMLWWWSRTIEAAMSGTAGSRAVGRATRKNDNRDPVARLLPRWAPRSRFGALMARETRYWWRETRRRAALITLAVAGVFLPLSTVFGTGGAGAGGLAVLVGAIAPIGLANQFGYEGSANATNLATGVPGRLEVHSRAAAHALFTVPMLLLVAAVTGFAAGGPGGVPAQVGMLLAVYGFGLALVLPISVVFAYALPDPTTPFALSSGGGISKALPSLGAMVGALIGAIPVLVAAYLLGPVWTWVGLPLGAGYGLGAYLIGANLAGSMLDRRMPEVLAAVTTR
ncbi:ABC-2 type transport system permease protein [Actinoplanes lutulentus]|uniref:ABC-2 type transport system permease protein n=1 Tax=Actinoplanes lutulentus TaxID=1287878 RepID=A0A327Z9B6_9ACTN|nr:ABC transporter permease [Actinoplanes lutulentus]MBB2944703.1 ABC-2 type transport system permease protein [Actinoplanes lutulentus]RAK35502.1 ABC-2 type transport system permease protein [Actinoplanes lutulentus]